MKRGRQNSSDEEQFNQPNKLPKIQAALNQQLKFPVIIVITKPEDISFLDLSFAQLHTFIKTLEKILKPIKSSRIANRGDLFVYPADEKQKTTYWAYLTEP